MIIALQTLLFFRESLICALSRLLQPYYKKLSLSFDNSHESDEESDEVFAEFDEEKGVVFFPPMYVQRYAAVTDCLMDERWSGKLEKVVDLGYHDMSFIKYLQEMPGVKCILGVDLDTIPLRCSSDLLSSDKFATKSEKPQITLFQGNAADPDYRLIGCDAVVSIEMIEHMLPHDLERLIHTVFGFIRPRVAIFTTPNGDFNVLFKALEKNGYRRLDHFFEWSREQFNDWCSNIVLRYPEYTVSCKGIGPGPPGTQHLGGCSQLAMFVSKDYHKQQDLNLQSLALVSNVPNADNIDDMLDSWDESDFIEHNMICSSNTVDSHINSFISIFLTPPQSLDNLVFEDKGLQCNLDVEVGKSFLMFDDDRIYFNVLTPRRWINQRVYYIENVNNRLNCTTLQVKKFSKATQSLLEKNKNDSHVHTRQVVDEIRQLAKMLNFNKNTQIEGSYTWCNINWADNAPYWNQYYKVIRDYTYPFEVKSDESRILDAISEEINRLIDTQYVEDSPTRASKLEIPLDDLMRVVEHLTTDGDKVRDLLEWNGYEIKDNVVIYTRVIEENVSDESLENWHDHDTVTDLDTTDVISTTISDGSTIRPDYYARCLRRALDRKLRNLRSMLTGDEDITAELDRVVGRLMKMALRTSLETPPSTNWLQCKLFDLLSLTEKAIERRRQRFIDNYPLKAIDFGYQNTFEDIAALDKFQYDDTVERIVDKYHHLIQSSENADTSDSFYQNYHNLGNVESDDAITSSSNELLSDNIIVDKTEEYKLEITKKWMEKGYMLRDHPEGGYKMYNGAKYRLKKTYRRSYFKKTRVVIKNSKAISSSNIFKNSRKMANGRYDNRYERGKKIIKIHRHLRSNWSKPIPGSLTAMCDSDLNNANKYENNSINITIESPDISATEESLFVNIVSADKEETIALRRSIGTEADTDSNETEMMLETVINITKEDSFYCKPAVITDNNQSQTIFLYDINEPSTSKGVRHITTEVQCGPDFTSSSKLCVTTSLTEVPIMLTEALKLGDSPEKYTNLKSNDFGTATDDNELNLKTVSPQLIACGIHIKDSETNMSETNEFVDKKIDNVLATDGPNNSLETEVIKPVSSIMKNEDSGSEFCGNITPIHYDTTKFISEDFQMSKDLTNADLIKKMSAIKYVRPKLGCGGIHVHSYRDRHVSEDVMYQGEWQRTRSKPAVRKYSYISRKYDAGKKKKDNIIEKSKEYEKKKYCLIKKPLQSRYNELTRKQDNVKRKREMNCDTAMKSIVSKKTVKFVSKLAVNSIPCKAVKSNSTVKSTLRNVNKKQESNNKTFIKKNYVPLYLKNMKKSLVNGDVFNHTLDHNKEEERKVFCRSKVEGIKNLLKFSDDPRKNISYYVYCNETEHKKNAPVIKFLKNTQKDPDSKNSSTCSSPNSVSTVKIASNICKLSLKKHSFVENNEYSKNKKIAKRKGYPNLEHDKENVPQSSKIANQKNNLPSPFSAEKSVYVAHLKMAKSPLQPSPACFSKTIEYANNKADSEQVTGQKLKPSSHMISKRQSCDDYFLLDNDANKNTVTNSASCQLFLKSIPNDQIDTITKLSQPFLMENDDEELLKSDHKGSKTSVNITRSNITAAIKQLVEEKLNKALDCDHFLDSETVIISRGGTENRSTNDSPISFKTIVTNENTCEISNSGIENALLRSFNTAHENESCFDFSDSRFTIADTDFLSFKSTTSVSRYSEYFSADNDLQTEDASDRDDVHVISIRELFERKEPQDNTNTGGVLASQIFSGFSMNGDPLVGDQLNYVNLVDPETGSISAVFDRQTTSEELFVAGRSVNPHESYWIDDESFVPDWLFQVITQQQSVEESVEQGEPLPIPVVAPIFDVDEEPGVGIGAGAGDGVGMHSDPSQDSSGRGSSLSSTDTSSEMPSEAIVIDQSNHFEGPIEFCQELSNNSENVPLQLAVELSDTSFRTAEAHEHQSPSSTRDCIPSTRRHSYAPMSDVDADISSLSTDVADSD